MVTVLVNYLNLISATNRVRTVSSRTGNRELKVSMTESKGDFADQMELMADRIYECGQTFSGLSAKTADILDEARIAFRQADESAAGQFSG